LNRFELLRITSPAQLYRVNPRSSGWREKLSKLQTAARKAGAFQNAIP
jgi:hypothetical protein